VASRPQFYISLFAGCGGLDLAAELAVPDARCVCYVEIDVPAATIQAARMEDGVIQAAPIYSDVRSLPGRIFAGRVDGIIGGFPCQDLSVAGKGAGISAGKRSGLWWEYLRLIEEIRPGWVFIENVSGLLGFPNESESDSDMEPGDADHGKPSEGTFRNLDAVLGPLSEIGYDAQWISLRASDLGAPHQRLRVFVLAYPNGDSWERNGGERSRNCQKWQGGNCFEKERNKGDRDASGCGVCVAYNDGRRRELEQLSSVYDGERAARGDDVDGFRRDVPDSLSAGLEGRQGQRSDDGEELQAAERVCSLFPPGPGDREAWRDILASSPWLAPATEPGVRGMVDGLAVVVDESRHDSLRAAGNGVVALQGALAFAVLARRAGLDL
jgi:DNA (cytosine-5)-methyltransferase 1